MLRLIDAQNDVRLDYVSIVDPDTFEEVDVVERSGVVAIAACVGSTRLIDNVVLE